MKAFHQLSTLKNLLANYSQQEPLHRFLAQYYRTHKHMGSKDRKIASRLIYNYFRLGAALKELDVEERLIIAEFLCNTITNSFLSHFKPEWAELCSLPIEDKINQVKAQYPDFEINNIFPFLPHLSHDIDVALFNKSLLIQPDLFIRVKR